MIPEKWETKERRPVIAQLVVWKYYWYVVQGGELKQNIVVFLR